MICCFSFKCFDPYKEKLWFIALITFVKFLIHFILVTGLLIGSCFIFVELEEQQTERPSKLNITVFWNSLIKKYNKTLLEDYSKINEIINEFDVYLKRQADIEKASSIWNQREDYYYLFKKWFYFTTIASTTIGYGDVAPVTQLGRVFFIVFALISVPAMMTLLVRCGAILTSLNVHFFRFVHNLCCKKKEILPEGMLSAMLFLVVIIAYMQIGPILTSIDELPWTYVDSIYYWFVTFTTIGFGDINYSINELQYFLLLYRIFGLALLAGLIDSLTKWAEKKKEDFKKLDKHSFRTLALTMSDGARKGLEALPKLTDSAVKGIDRIIGERITSPLGSNDINPSASFNSGIGSINTLINNVNLSPMLSLDNINKLSDSVESSDNGNVTCDGNINDICAPCDRVKKRKISIEIFNDLDNDRNSCSNVGSSSESPSDIRKSSNVGSPNEFLSDSRKSSTVESPNEFLSDSRNYSNTLPNTTNKVNNNKEINEDNSSYYVTVNGQKYFIHYSAL